MLQHVEVWAQLLPSAVIASPDKSGATEQLLCGWRHFPPSGRPPTGNRPFILAVEYIPPFVWWLCKLLTMHHVQACMDREKQDEVASLQLAWIDGICLPLYKVGISRKHVNHSFLTSFSTSPVPSLIHSFPFTHTFCGMCNLTFQNIL